ncbi:MAG: 2-hydroxy-3-oxopropionate reductase [Deltaproteobacteria bacterium]|nr:2-hydroxy-3-oxopropionate reductase [Deltaproteobacteria bacterium]
MANLGFIGLGIMGKPMASHLQKGGNTLHVYDVVDTGVQALVALGAVKCSTPKDVAQKSEVIFLMVPDTPDVEKVLFGENGVLEGASKGKVVVDMSSISPVATKKFAARLAEKGVEMIDAPVSGGQLGAENAALTIMCGGKEQVFSKIRPYFEKMGKNINLVGGHGDGQTAKVANQIIVALTIEAVGEALLFASKAGANPENVRKALLGGFAQSRILEVHGERMIKRTFQPGFRIRHQQKDLNNALTAARELGISLPHTASAQELYNAVAADGGIDLDHSALVNALERMAKHTVA